MHSFIVLNSYSSSPESSSECSPESSSGFITFNSMLTRIYKNYLAISDNPFCVIKSLLASLNDNIAIDRYGFEQNNGVF